MSRVHTRRTIKQLIPAPSGTRAVLKGVDGETELVDVLAFALCDALDDDCEEGEEYQEICGVFAGEELDLCEDLLDGQLQFYLAPGEKLTRALLRVHKLKKPRGQR